RGRRERRRAGRGRRRGGALVREAAAADCVDRCELVVVGGAVGEAAVRVARDVARGREEALPAAGGAAVDAVAGNLGGAVGGWGARGEGDASVSGCGGGDRGCAGHGGRGGGALVGEAAGADRVDRGDLVVVGGAVGDRGVGVAGDVADGREQALAAAGGAAV